MEASLLDSEHVTIYLILRIAHWISMKFGIEGFTLKVDRKIYFLSISAYYNPSLCEAEIGPVKNLVAVQNNSCVTKRNLIKNSSIYLKLISILFFYTT
jgi:hypothetical protein